MDGFKVTSWNIEHSHSLLGDANGTDAKRKRHALARIEAIKEEITALNADILFVSEGPRGEDLARAFFAEVAPDYDLVLRPGQDDDSYGMKGGNSFTGQQWLWFLIKKDTPITGSLLHLDQWNALTEQSAGESYKNSSNRWKASFPKMAGGTDDEPEQIDFSISETHGHWRHPQVLQANIDGSFVEFIGCHLKSKYNDVKPAGDPADDSFFENNPKLVTELIKARVKITTECTDLRHYIDARFQANQDAAIVVMGDLNDGPGKERIERRFMYHDLIGSLQGDVFYARRFLNHALFDAKDSERWSVHFEDKLDPGRDPHILLDHILFSQAMTRSHWSEETLAPLINRPYLARSKGGLVEHEVHHQVTSTRFKYAMTSDHKPVSMHFDRASALLG